MKSLDTQLVIHSPQLRRKLTAAELKLWGHLRARCLAGARFKRQYVVGTFIVDFYCAEHLLVVEVDGGGHADSTQAEYDRKRTDFLHSQGLRVVRFWNHDVLERTSDVLAAIVAERVHAGADNRREERPHPAQRIIDLLRQNRTALPPPYP